MKLIDQILNLIFSVVLVLVLVALMACDTGGGVIRRGSGGGLSASVYTASHGIFLPGSVEVNKEVSGDFDGAVVMAGRSSVATETADDAELELSDRDVSGFVAQVPAQEGEATASGVVARIDIHLNSGQGDFNPRYATLVSRQTQDGGDAVFSIYRLDLYTPLTIIEMGNFLVQMLGLSQADGVIEALPVSSVDDTEYTTYLLYLTVIYYAVDDVYISAAVSASELVDYYQPVLTGITSYTNVGDRDVEVRSDALTKIAAGGGGRADFLFVIDNSGSMSDEQQAISQAGTDFETAMINSGLDYHMAVITTDSAELRDSNLDGGFTSSLEEFQNDVVVGSRGGNSSESGIWFGEQALLPEGSVVTAGYPREGASLSVVMMSDEVDQYAKHASGMDFDVSNNLFYQNGYRVYTIVDSEPTSSQYGGTYINLADATGGSYASIDELSAFTEIMTQIAANAGGASSIYQLNYYPITGSIEVAVDGGIVPNDVYHGWTYNLGSNTIVFHGTAIPTAGQTVELAYDYL